MTEGENYIQQKSTEQPQILLLVGSWKEKHSFHFHPILLNQTGHTILSQTCRHSKKGSHKQNNVTCKTDGQHDRTVTK